MRANTRLYQILLLYDVSISQIEDIYHIRMTHKYCGELTVIRANKLPLAIKEAYKAMNFRIKFEDKHKISIYDAMF